MVVVALLVAAGPPAAASEGSLRPSLATNGVWPGVGKICEPGPGGASSQRGVGDKAIHIAVYTDASNTVEPGLQKEFVQAGERLCRLGPMHRVESTDARSSWTTVTRRSSTPRKVMAQGVPERLHGSRRGPGALAKAVPVREQCSLGQITGFTVSDAVDTASDQVNPNNISLNHIPAGWFLALAKKYPQAVKRAGMGGQNSNETILEPEHKWADAPQQLGWTIAEFQEPPLSVTNSAPIRAAAANQRRAGGVASLLNARAVLSGDDDSRLPSGLRRSGHPGLQFRYPQSTAGGRRPSGLRRNELVAARAWPTRMPRRSS